MNTPDINEQILRESDHLRGIVPEIDLYIQLAEEASELSQAACKIIRRLRGGYVAMQDDELLRNLREELTDVLVVAMDVMGWDADPETELYKLKRWNQRIRGENNPYNEE